MAFIKQTNSAIIGAIGFSGYKSFRKSRKRKDWDNLPGSNREDPQICQLRKDQQVKKIISGPSALTVVPVCQIGASAALASSKITYSRRSLLAGTIQQQDMRELCSILMVVAQASMILADQNDSMQTVRENQTATFLANRDAEKFHKGPEFHKATPNAYLGRDHENKYGKVNSHPGDADAQKWTPRSPGTLALLCDENNVLFTLDASSDRVKNCVSNTDIHIQQERLVLITFLDFLNRLITRGNVKGSSMSTPMELEFDFGTQSP
ncbi:hypothetical protein Acr_00g0090280 [Actinidia rufa]|uniref:Uncharacterized protein n=1 Tax=Actinidia rufa TaxID=165716 RepID=A0A7J0DWV1_9ERIC|nr:hypothetical protein Acr_00g0090280 [Actinidia rufa]